MSFSCQCNPPPVLSSPAVLYSSQWPNHWTSSSALTRTILSVSYLMGYHCNLYTFTHTHTHTHVHIHRYTQARTHAHTHTHTQCVPQVCLTVWLSPSEVTDQLSPAPTPPVEEVLPAEALGPHWVPDAATQGKDLDSNTTSTSVMLITNQCTLRLHLYNPSIYKSCITFTYTIYNPEKNIASAENPKISSKSGGIFW